MSMCLLSRFKTMWWEKLSILPMKLILTLSLKSSSQKTRCKIFLCMTTGSGKSCILMISKSTWFWIKTQVLSKSTIKTWKWLEDLNPTNINTTKNIPWSSHLTTTSSAQNWVFLSMTTPFQSFTLEIFWPLHPKKLFVQSFWMKSFTNLHHPL